MITRCIHWDKLKIDQIFQCSSCIMWHSPTCIMWHSPTCIMRHSPTCILALYLQTVRGTRCNTARSSIHIIYICRPAKDSAWHVRSSIHITSYLQTCEGTCVISVTLCIFTLRSLGRHIDGTPDIDSLIWPAIAHTCAGNSTLPTTWAGARSCSTAAQCQEHVLVGEYFPYSKWEGLLATANVCVCTNCKIVRAVCGHMHAVWSSRLLRLLKMSGFARCVCPP